MTPSAAMEDLLDSIENSLADLRLDDGEKHSLAQTLRQAQPPEDSFRQLRNHAFALARNRLAAQLDPMDVLRWLEAVVRALDVARAPAQAIRSSAWFSPGEACLNTIVHHLRSARRSVDVCVFTLSDDRIAQEMLAAHSRGVALRFITDNDKETDSGSDVARLRAVGVHTVVDRTDAHMHHKFAIFDGQWLLNGSYNWTRSACTHNEENLVATNDAGLVRQFQGVFDELWGQLGD
ncbi:MAG: phospholipase D-like domain-containing protein [Burkholderiaceae bacterium]